MIASIFSANGKSKLSEYRFNKALIPSLMMGLALHLLLVAETSASIIVTGFTGVVDSDFNQFPIQIGPGNTDVGPNLGYFVASNDSGPASLTVDGGSILSGGKLTTGSLAPSTSSADVTVSGSGSTIALTHPGPAGVGGLDLASQGYGDLLINNGGKLTFETPTGLCAAGACFAGGLAGAAGSVGNIVVTGAGSSFDVDAENTQFFRIGAAAVNSDGFGTPGGSSTASVSILDGATFATGSALVAVSTTGDANTGAESVTSSVAVTGNGSTWNSDNIAIGFRLPGAQQPSVSGTVIVANGGVINSPQVNVGAFGLLGGNGTLNGNVSVFGGLVSPGLSPGTLNINGDFLMDAGTLLIEVGGLSSGEYDVLSVTGAIEILAGEILFSFVDDYIPKVGDMFDFLAAGTGIQVAESVGYAYSGLAPGFEFSVDPNTGEFVALNDGAAIPSPATLTLFGLGLAGLGWSRRKRKKA